MRSKDLEPCDCYNNIKLIIAFLLRQQPGHEVGYPWLQGFDDGLAGDAGKCTWQCVTCLDMGVQLHLNEGGIVYCAHILSNTPSTPPSPTAAAVGPQHMWAALRGEGVHLTNTNNTNYHLSYFQRFFIFKLLLILILFWRAIFVNRRTPCPGTPRHWSYFLTC